MRMWDWVESRVSGTVGLKMDKQFRTCLVIKHSDWRQGENVYPTGEPGNVGRPTPLATPTGAFVWKYV